MNEDAKNIAETELCLAVEEASEVSTSLRVGGRGGGAYHLQLQLPLFLDGGEVFPRHQLLQLKQLGAEEGVFHPQQMVPIQGEGVSAAQI